MDKTKDAENILQQLGSRGRWQMSIYVLHATLFGSFGLLSSVAVYLVDTPPYHCKVPVNSTFNETIPSEWEDGKLVSFNPCEEYVNISYSNQTQPCSQGYWFDPKYGYDETITTEFELVCDKAIMVEHLMVASTVIYLFVFLAASYIIDKVGRKIPLVVGVIVRPLFGIGCSFVQDFYVRWGINILAGTLEMGLINGSFLLALEMFPSNKRTMPATVMEVVWAVGMLLCTPFLYYFRNWRHLLRALYIPTFPFYLIVLAPESITWLVQKGKYKKVKEIVLQAARFNKKKPSAKVMNLLERRIAEGNVEGRRDKTMKDQTIKDQTIKDSNISTPRLTYRDLLRHPTIRKYLFIQIFIWFVNSFVYWALSLTITYLPGDRYVNFASYAVAELVASAMHVSLLMRFGRRIPLFIFHVVAGVGLVLTIIEVFKDELHFNWVPLVITCNVVGRLGITASFMTIYLFTPEIFPTSVRAMAVGVCTFSSGLSGLIIPYTRVLERNHPGLLRGICGVFAIVAGLLGLLLPETHNRPLPETIMDIETKIKDKMGRNNDNNVDSGLVNESQSEAL